MNKDDELQNAIKEVDEDVSSEIFAEVASELAIALFRGAGLSLSIELGDATKYNLMLTPSRTFTIPTSRPFSLVTHNDPFVVFGANENHTSENYGIGRFGFWDDELSFRWLDSPPENPVTAVVWLRIVQKTLRELWKMEIEPQIEPHRDRTAMKGNYNDGTT